MEIRPITDLRNNFADISRLVKEKDEPVFLTKNGHGDMVVMSIETYSKQQANQELKAKILESEAQYQKDKKLYSSDEVFDMMMKTIEEKFNVQSNLQLKG